MATPTGKAIDAAYLKTQLKNFDTAILEKKYQRIIQFATMPTAAAGNKGDIVQFIGESTSDYTNGYFYKCVEEAGPTYKWVAVTTQAEAQEYTIKKADTAESGMSATYQLYKGETAIGDKINIPKDWLLKNVTLNTCTEANKPETGFVVGDKYFDFEFNVKEEAQETSIHVYLKVNDLVDVYTGGNGITVGTNNSIAVDLGAIPGLEFTGDDSDKLSVKAGNGIEVTADGVKVNVDAAGPITVGADGVNINIEDSLAIDSTSKKLKVAFETTNIDFSTEWE